MELRVGGLTGTLCGVDGGQRRAQGGRPCHLGAQHGLEELFPSYRLIRLAVLVARLVLLRLGCAQNLGVQGERERRALRFSARHVIYAISFFGGREACGS